MGIFDNISNQELKKLTENEVLELIKMECRQQGLIYPDEPKYKEKLDRVETERIKAYYISYLYNSIYFKTKDSASEFLAYINNNENILNTDRAYQSTVLVNNQKAVFGDVCEESIITLDSANKIAEAKRKNRDIDNYNHEIRKQYNIAYDKISHIAQPIWDRYFSETKHNN